MDRSTIFSVFFSAKRLKDCSSSLLRTIEGGSLHTGLMLIDSIGTPLEVRPGTTLAWPLVLYTLTGFSGILAEQAFEKYIALLVGATVYSSAIVIFSYFLGFSLGSWAVARLALREKIRWPLRTYGTLELLIGILCVTFTYGFHPLMARLAPFQSAATSPVHEIAVRFAFGAILILPAAALMGASFPLIAQVFESSAVEQGKNWVVAYGCNLGGAVVAALGGAYVVLPAAGLRGAMWICFAIGTVVWAVSFLLPEPRREAAGQVLSASPNTKKQNVRNGGLLIGAAFLTGLVIFSLEVVWTHLLGTLIGSSVYAFSSMLAMVLTGLFLGSIRARRTKQASGVVVFSRTLQFSALLLIVQFRLWDYSQAAFLIELPHWIKSFYTIELFKFLLGSLLIVPSATLLGSLYPMLLRNPGLDSRGASYFVAYLNTANSAGCLSGALLGVFFFIPIAGSEWSLKLIAVALLIAGLAFLWMEHPSRKAMVKAVAGGLVIVGYALAWHWNPVLLTSGINVYFGRTNLASQPAKPEASPEPSRLELSFFEEDPQGGFTTVVDTTTGERRTRMLLSNGKYEGSDDLLNQGLAQISFAGVPSQFNAGFESALLIGLGTGQSAHALDAMGFRSVRIAEFAPGIVHAARRSFGSINGGVLDEPSVNLSLEDGRNMLLVAAPQSLDVVSIEITSVWFAGATNVYSKEFYELAKSRLRPGGALAQWIQFHHIRPREIAVTIATLRAVFPYVSVWHAGGQGMLIATDHPQQLTAERREYLNKKLSALPEVPESMQSLLREQVFDKRMLDPDSVDRLLANGFATINTDHNRWLEYATPRYNWMDDDWNAKNLNWLRSFAKGQQTAKAAR